MEREPNPSAAGRAPARGGPTPTCLTVLVVDDEPGMRMGVERALRGYQVVLPDFDQRVTFEVRSVGDGEQALVQLEAGGIDVVLLDHKLPGIQGLDLLDTLSARHRDVLTIMITAYASIEAAISATKRGAFDFLSKPFTPGELRSTLQKATRHLMLQREARRLSREKRQLRFQLISVVAHELKAPLAAIEGYLRLLKDDGGAGGEDPATRERMLDRSLVRLDGMRKLIFDLLDLTRIESGQRRRNLQPVDLRELVAAAVEGQATEAAARGIRLSLQAPESGPQMTADPSELQMIFGNLVSNAVKYNRDGGAVDVALREQAGRAVVTVRDTGIGMTAEEKGRLFGEFVRIKNAKTTRILGSGLGLSIVKRVVALYGGNVTVDSTPDVGSTFTVELPLVEAAATPAPEARADGDQGERP